MMYEFTIDFFVVVVVELKKKIPENNSRKM